MGQVIVRAIEQGQAEYPSTVSRRQGDAAPSRLYTMGDGAILREPLLGLICSIRCPGSVVIKTFDAIRELRDAGVVVAGGFHSPMERDCLDILFRGPQPVVLCAAKGLRGLRLGKTARAAIAESRLLVISSFADRVRRTTAAQAVRRNDLVAALSESILVPHATPGGKTWNTVSAVLDRGQALCTFRDPENAELIAAGAVPVTPLEVVGKWLRRLGQVAR